MAVELLLWKAIVRPDGPLVFGATPVARSLIRVLAALTAVVFAEAANAGVQAPRVVGVPVDIEIAIDGTGSMGPAIESAKRDANELIRRINDSLPNARFAVVVFRDFGSSGEEYEILQPLTDDAQLVEQAFSRLRTYSNRTAANGSAESYNLLFRMSYTDTRLGWRPAAKRLVVVLGDAQPQSAGTVGLPGCSDTHPDQHGLNTLTELANMRAAGRTLLFVRQIAPETTVSLACYQSIAARAAAGGAAVDSGRDLVAPIMALVQQALAPLTLGSDRRLVRSGALARFTVTVTNATGEAVDLDELVLKLPRGFVYQRGSTTGASNRNPTVTGQTLMWRHPVVGLRPGARLRLQVSSRVTAWLGGRYRAQARATVRTADNRAFTTISSVCSITVQNLQRTTAQARK